MCLPSEMLVIVLLLDAFSITCKVSRDSRCRA